MIRLKNILKEVYFSGLEITEANSAFHRPENFDQYAEGKGWTAWRGGNDWENGSTAATVVFEGEDKSRMWFTIKYPNDLSDKVAEAISERHPAYERINKLGKRITNKWIREATRIHRIPKNYGHNGRPIKRDWKECFQAALESKILKPFVKESGVDYTKWHAMKRDKTAAEKEIDQEEDKFHTKHDAEPNQMSGLSHTHLPDDR
jgi:hypothetical protein